MHLFCLTAELTIGWERNFTSVNENHGLLEVCLIIRDVNEYYILIGFSVKLFVSTIHGTAAGKMSLKFI